MRSTRFSTNAAFSTNGFPSESSFGTEIETQLTPIAPPFKSRSASLIADKLANSGSYALGSQVELAQRLAERDVLYPCSLRHLDIHLFGSVFASRLEPYSAVRIFLKT